MNRAPTATIASPSNNTKFTTNDNIVFDATGSYDPDSDNLTYTWTSNIGENIGNTKTFSTKLSAGTHVITLTVSDGLLSDSKQITITVEGPSSPQPSWRFIPTDGAIFAICAIIVVIMVLHRSKKCS